VALAFATDAGKPDGLFIWYDANRSRAGQRAEGEPSGGCDAPRPSATPRPGHRGGAEMFKVNSKPRRAVTH